MSLRNDNPYAVEPWRAVGNSLSIPPSKPLLFGSGNVPAGLFVVVPRQAAPGIGFHAAVRDTSRADSEWATEIPVVREVQFAATGVELLDIPADPRYRTTLCVYSPTNPVPGYATFVHVIVYSLDDGGTLCEFYPSFGDPIQVQANVLLWAFATVTNNETQHVTVVSPH